MPEVEGPDPRSIVETVADSGTSTPMSEPEALGFIDLDPGSQIGRYVVLERIGAGAVGVVFGAYDPELARKIAIKLLRPRGGEGMELSTRRSRLMREAQALARLSHPNVVAVHDVGTFEGRVYVAMEHIELDYFKPDASRYNLALDKGLLSANGDVEYGLETTPEERA